MSSITLRLFPKLDQRNRSFIVVPEVLDVSVQGPQDRGYSLQLVSGKGFLLIYLVSLKCYIACSHATACAAQLCVFKMDLVYADFRRRGQSQWKRKRNLEKEWKVCPFSDFHSSSLLSILLFRGLLGYGSIFLITP